MMRRFSPFLLLALLLAGCQDEGRRPPMQTLPKSAGQDDAEDTTPPTEEEKKIALERLDRAIAAHGGPVRLQKLRRHVQKLKGMMRYADAGAIQAEQEIKIHLPDQMYTHAKVFLTKGPQEVRLGWTGDAGWMTQLGTTVEMEATLARSFREELHFQRAKALLPLKDDDVKLRPIDGPPIERKKTVGLRVMSKNHANLELFFDEETHLLIGIKCGRHFEGGILQRREVVFGDFRPFEDKLLLPTRVKDVRDDISWGDFTIDYKLVDKFDPKEFQRP